MFWQTNKKLDRLEAELNQCLKEKKAIDAQLHDLEREQFSLVRASSTEANKSFHGDEPAKDFDELVEKNQEIQNTIESMGKVLQDINQLVDKMRGTYGDKKETQKSGVDQQASSEIDDLVKTLNDLDESPERNAHEPNPAKKATENHQKNIDEAKSEEPNESRGESESDVGSSIAELLASPAVLKLIPSLVKALSK